MSDEIFACSLCNLNDIEDEFHFKLVCPFDHEHIDIKKMYYRNPNTECTNSFLC